MLELGKAGAQKGVLPVLRDGAVVATLAASGWKEAATATVGDREWVFAKNKDELSARWAAEPESAARFRAAQKSFWNRTWSVELDGTAVDMQPAWRWKGTHRYLIGKGQVAESGTTGRWSSWPTLTADDSLSLDQQVFLLWLELVIRRRNTAAALSAGTGAAVIGGSS